MSWLYNIVKYTGRFALPLFFSRVEFNGLDNIPAKGPFILAPNHQNAFLDAIILGSLMNPSVHFLTRSDVFIKPYDTILALLNMMPVYRMRDGFEHLSKNDETFEKCFDVLKKGELVLIFPEANLASPGYALRSLSKGFARLAFQAQDRMTEDLIIIPVGLNYLDHDRPRHKLIINYGEALEIPKYRPITEEELPKALNLLKKDLALRLEQLMLIPRADEYYDQKVETMKRLSENLSFHELKTCVANLQAPPAMKMNRSQILISLLELVNYGPLALIRFVLKHKVKDPQFILSLKFVLGIILFPLWWLFLFVLVALLSSAGIALVSILLAVILLFMSQNLKKHIPL